MTADEHCVGRVVEDIRLQIESNAVSAKHCRIFRKRAVTEDAGHFPHYDIFLKDTRLALLKSYCLLFRNKCVLRAFEFCSTNGTYLNWERLRKNSSEVKVHHGDIISFAAPPQHGNINSHFQ